MKGDLSSSPRKMPFSRILHSSRRQNDFSITFTLNEICRRYRFSLKEVMVGIETVASQ